MTTPAGDGELMERALEYVSESVGDVVPVVLERYYHYHPEAEKVFRDFGFEEYQRMAQSMVDEVLHCIITWADEPAEVKSVIAETVPHHRSLKIPDQLLITLLDVVLDVLVTGLPTGAGQERALLERVGLELKAEIEHA